MPSLVGHSEIQNFYNTKSLALTLIPSLLKLQMWESAIQMLGILGLCFLLFGSVQILFTTFQLLSLLDKRKLNGIQNILQMKTLKC